MIDLRHLTYTDADRFSWVEVDLRYEQFKEVLFSEHSTRNETHEFLLRFANTPIRKIAERMMRHYPGKDAVEVFQNTQADVQSDLFGTFVSLCERFDRHKMDRQRIWLWGELADDDVNFAKEPLVIRGGHHRCLVYIVKVMMGDLPYRPVRALVQVRGRDWRQVV